MISAENSVLYMTKKAFYNILSKCFLQNKTISIAYTVLIPHLDSCVQLRSPQHKKDMDLLDWVQRSATKMI